VISQDGVHRDRFSYYTPCKHLICKDSGKHGPCTRLVAPNGHADHDHDIKKNAGIEIQYVDCLD
jgi:hypothetical protein